ncbi:hypothetical protein [Paludisphaera mucosa]|uniref:Integrase n=1 Tax=Paludisphaera mucosa TaxID=3030827 RepID=A0ABT6F4D2_9BACT|nr:hypothetical protein [Paludisphaera mucosa]MDG3002431.1 hypothetical protein [Paludisphaera mucosa]
MAGVHERNGSWRVLFNLRGKKHAFTLGRVTEAEARSKADQVAYLLMRIGQAWRRSRRASPWSRT